MPKSARLRLTVQFPDLIAKAGLSQRGFARRAGISFSTVMGLLHPELHPGQRGGMQRRTAWMLIQAYAELMHIDSDAAFHLLIVEYPEDSLIAGAPKGSSMMRLEDLRTGVSLRGILPDGLVTVVAVQWYGSDAVDLTYKDANGRPATRLLYRDDEPSLELVSVGRLWIFDGDGLMFRLVSEAHRSDELLFLSLAPSSLWLEMDKILLWRGNHVAVRQLIEHFVRYHYPPRLRNAAVLLDAIQAGVNLNIWALASFAYAESYDAVTERYRDLRTAMIVSVDKNGTTLVIHPDAARRQIEAETPPSVLSQSMQPRRTRVTRQRFFQHPAPMRPW